jgi:glycosyltransferase involved in cell wall biosynthesis
MSEPLRVLVLARYGSLGASSRLRILQYLPLLRQSGLEVTVQPLLSDGLLQARYRDGGYGVRALIRAYAARSEVLLRRRHFDLVWVEKEALPWWPLWIETALLRGVPYVLDYDDAVFHNYDLHARALVRRLFGRRIDGLMAGASLVVAGNRYLAQRALAAGARQVEILPTVVDLERYPHRPGASAIPPATVVTPRIVWIGSPSTARYLQVLREPLAALARERPFILRVIGGGAVDLPGVQVETVTWSEATEVADVGACDVGVMPLLDSPWEQGKCGYKLIQYMACGLPVVASGVGVNPEIVEQGDNGFLAETPAEWLDALRGLLADPSRREAMGAAGRRRVERSYCLQQTGPKLAALLRSATQSNH